MAKKIKHLGDNSFVFSNTWSIFGHSFEERYTVEKAAMTFSHPSITIEHFRDGKKNARKVTIEINADHLMTLANIIRRKTKVSKMKAVKAYEERRAKESCANNSTSSSATTGAIEVRDNKEVADEREQPI